MNPLTSVKGSLITGFVIAILFAVLSINDGGLERARTRALAAHHRRHHLDRPALLLQCRADAGARGSRGRQGRPRRRGHHRSTSPRAACCGSAGRRSSPGSRVPGISPARAPWAVRSPSAWRAPSSTATSSSSASAPGSARSCCSTSGCSSGRTRRRSSASCRRRDEQKAAARKTALYASRTNYILSIPMLLCMAGATHGLPF